MRRGAIVAAQLLVVFLALWALRDTVRHLSFVLIPLIVALLLASVLNPVVGWLCRRHLPRGIAVTLAVIGGLILVGGLVTFVVYTVVSNADELGRQAVASLGRLRQWLERGGLPVGGNVIDQVERWLSEHQQGVVSGTVDAVTTIGRFAAGALIALVLLVLMLADGPRIWGFLLTPWRPATRELLDDAGHRAFHSLSLYVRVTALIAFIDAVTIGIGLVALGVPLSFALAALVFLGGFVPYAGAFISGTLSVAVALVSNGPMTALLVLAVVVGVQQLEGHVLHPVLSGNVVRLHPIVVLLAVVIGGAEGGVVGALFAVPAVAATRSVVRAVIEHRNRDARPSSAGADQGSESTGDGDG
ncbi:AI-2E family transporter [Allokutzneria oryzae]|uniref:AI-2E family transporter n=1 Tax=Allokutzneria oryzae TaxID=1378989 RepID=A0ABV6A1Y0_9PSEU